MLEPTFHKPIPMGTRVIIHTNFLGALEPNHGEVVGIASMHVFFMYIVLLDVPLKTEYGLQKAVAIPGMGLMGENGTSFEVGR